jgi:hypothetical protein
MAKSPKKPQLIFRLANKTFSKTAEVSRGQVHQQPGPDKINDYIVIKDIALFIYSWVVYLVGTARGNDLLGPRPYGRGGSFPCLDSGKK